jgi:hypothetical protein
MNGNPPVAKAATLRRQGRRPFSHSEAEQQHWDKLHWRFCDLRTTMSTVSKMDKASLLADASAYITELHACVEQLKAWVMMPLPCLLKCLLGKTKSKVAPHPSRIFLRNMFKF